MKRAISDTVLVYENEQGEKHREDGPSYIEFYYGSKIKNPDNLEESLSELKIKDIREEKWYIHDKIHRIDGPAIMHYFDGRVTREEYFLNNMRHRLDGPAEVSYYPHFDNFGSFKKLANKLFKNFFKLSKSEETFYINGLKHRENGPAQIMYFGKYGKREAYFINGVFHCEDGPAVRNYDGKGELVGYSYYKHGKFHNENGPAIFSNATEQWRIEDKLHRIGGPAKTDKTEYLISEYYYKNDILDNREGPAIKRKIINPSALEESVEEEEYYIDGIKYSKTDYHRKIFADKMSQELRDKTSRSSRNKI